MCLCVCYGLMPEINGHSFISKASSFCCRSFYHTPNLDNRANQIYITQVRPNLFLFTHAQYNLTKNTDKCSSIAEISLTELLNFVGRMTHYGSRNQSPGGLAQHRAASSGNASPSFIVNFIFNVVHHSSIAQDTIDLACERTRSRRRFGPKFQVEGVAPTNHSSCQKTRINRLLCGIRMLAQVSFVFVTIHAFDRHTAGRKDIWLVAIPCVALHTVAR